MRDQIVLGLVVLSFATLLTVHVAIAYGLLWRRPRWRSAAALFGGPVAPIIAWREGLRVRAGIWVGALVLYGVARILAAR